MIIKVGRVVDTRDDSAGGKLTIAPLDSNGDESGSTIQAVASSPNIGDGHGFLSVPGPGSLVIYVEAPPIRYNKIRVPVQYFWLGAIALPMLQTMGRSSLSHDKNDADESNNTQKDPLARTPSDSKHIYDSGIPEGQLMYSDNDLPQKDIWKHKKGHKIIMSHKITDKGTHDTGILVQSSSGKHIHINDGHPDAGANDRIKICDEKVSNEGGPNMFEIISGGDKADTAWLKTERDQTHISHKGNQLHEIAKGSGSQRRENKGSGDIVDKAYKGQHITEAENGIRRTTSKGDIIEVCRDGDITYAAEDGNVTVEASDKVTVEASDEIVLKCGQSTITLSPLLVKITSPTIDLNGLIATGGDATTAGGIGLGTHIHGEQQPLLSVTSPPQDPSTAESRVEDPDTGNTFFDGTSRSFVARRAPTASEASTGDGTPSASRIIKLFVISIGQSNNGTTTEGDLSDPTGGPLTAEDVPDPTIFELSQGLTDFRFVGHYVAPKGERHVFTHPAQDDRGGICMRLPAAKEIRKVYKSLIPEVTVFCGAEGSTSLSAGRDEWEPTGRLTQQTIAYCNKFMLENPDYTPVIWCSLGAEDALRGMPPADFEAALSGLASTLRTSIHNAENAFWVQGDMPQSLVDQINSDRGDTNGTDILAKQQSSDTFIPNSGTATMNDLQTIFDNVHLNRDSLRTFGRRVATATIPWLASVALAQD